MLDDWQERGAGEDLGSGLLELKPPFLPPQAGFLKFSGVKGLD